MSNPYTLRPVTAVDYFVAARGGRGAQAHRLLQNLTRLDPAPDCISILGERRFGKTSLLGYLQQAVAGVPNVRAATVNLLALSSPTPEGFYTALTRALIWANALPADRRVLNYLDFQDYLYALRRAGERLILFIDEFDLVARDRRFPPEFFNQLLAALNHLPLTLVLASLAPLAEIARSLVEVSPFFGIFQNREHLKPLSPPEVSALINSPPGGQHGLSDIREEIAALAGSHPYFLQLVCYCAWELREGAGSTIDLEALRSTFSVRARDHFQLIWDHRTPEEREALCALVQGTRSGATEFTSLVERGYVTREGSLDLTGIRFAEFVRSQCEVALPCRRDPSPDGLQPKPATVPELLRPMKTSRTAPELRLALILGVNRYLHQQAGDYYLPALQYAERDAEAVAEFLTQTLGFVVMRLTEERVTYASVLEAFEWLQRTTSADPHPNSCFVIHFSGHGQLDPTNDEVGYLMLYDTDPRNPAGTGLEMTHLVYQLLARVRVPNTLVFLDTCHAGIAAGVKTVRAKNMVMRPTNQISNVAQQLFCGLRGRMILAACPGEAKAREESSLGHGVFTYYVLKHWRDLDGAPSSGRITFASLVDYVGDSIRQNHPLVPLPVYSGVGVGSTFILRHV